MKLNKVILAPDSFKGTMSAAEICDIWEKAVKAHFDAETVKLPMADGGEGMTKAYLNIMGGELKTCQVHAPLGDMTEAFWGDLGGGRAVMEMAAAAGLELTEGRRNILASNTFGVGEMILEAERNGISEIMMGIGGSATNDGGIGMAAALGYRFMQNGKELEPIPKNLVNITEIVSPESLPKLRITAACDVDNPLTGESGATKVFGPQKGADENSIPALEAGLENLARVMKSSLGKDVSSLKGAGAAGGLGAGLFAFLEAELKPGIELLLDAAGFDEMLRGADLVLTGEGRIDSQSAHGKVPVGISERAKKKGVPCIALCGSIGKGAEAVYDHGITAVYASVSGAMSMEEIKKSCKDDMYFLADSLMRTISIK